MGDPLAVPAAVAIMRRMADALSYQSECRPRPSRSREALRAAVTDIFDAIRHIEAEDGE